MPVLLLAFLAGCLTVLAPCILPLLPVVLGGSLASGSSAAKSQRLRAVVIVGSLVLSVVAFSLLLKASTALLGVPQTVWQAISGMIIIIFGVVLLFPQWWAGFVVKTGFLERSHTALMSGSERGGTAGAVIMGLALGPIFNSCSPTYALIVATILPVSFLTGLSYLIAYALGLGATLLAIALLGQRLIDRLGWLSNPTGGFHKFLAIVFILTGLMILFGVDKDIQAYVLENGWYDPISGLEDRLR